MCESGDLALLSHGGFQRQTGPAKSRLAQPSAPLAQAVVNSRIRSMGGDGWFLFAVFGICKLPLMDAINATKTSSKWLILLIGAP
jgi:hypothetical protein